MNSIDSSTNTYNGLLQTERTEVTQIGLRRKQYALEQDLKNDVQADYVKQITGYLERGSEKARNIYDMIEKEQTMVTDTYKMATNRVTTSNRN
jgi:hypothetical protein